MANPFGIVVKSRGAAWLFTTSEDAEESADRLATLVAQDAKRLEQKRQLLVKMYAAAEAMRQREAEGRARRPARKTEAA